MANSILSNFWTKPKDQHDLSDLIGLLGAVETLPPSLHILPPDDVKQINSTFSFYTKEAMGSENDRANIRGIVLEFQQKYLKDVLSNAHALSLNGLIVCLASMKSFQNNFLSEMQTNYSETAQILLGACENKIKHAAPGQLSLIADSINCMPKKHSVSWMPTDRFFENYFGKAVEFIDSSDPNFNKKHYMHILVMPANLYTTPTQDFTFAAEQWGLNNIATLDENHIINISGALKNYECFCGVRFDRLSKQLNSQLRNIVDRPATQAAYKKRAEIILAIQPQ